jgi:hypothetical protein
MAGLLQQWEEQRLSDLSADEGTAGCSMPQDDDDCTATVPMEVNSIPEATSQESQNLQQGTDYLDKFLDELIMMKNAEEKEVEHEATAAKVSPVQANSEEDEEESTSEEESEEEEKEKPRETRKRKRKEDSDSETDPGEQAVREMEAEKQKKYTKTRTNFTWGTFTHKPKRIKDTDMGKRRKVLELLYECRMLEDPETLYSEKNAAVPMQRLHRINMLLCKPHVRILGYAIVKNFFDSVAKISLGSVFKYKDRLYVFITRRSAEYMAKKQPEIKAHYGDLPTRFAMTSLTGELGLGFEFQGNRFGPVKPHDGGSSKRAKKDSNVSPLPEKMGSYTFPKNGMTWSDASRSEILVMPAQEFKELYDILRCFEKVYPPSRDTCVTEADLNITGAHKISPFSDYQYNLEKQKLDDGMKASEVGKNGCASLNPGAGFTEYRLNDPDLHEFYELMTGNKWVNAHVCSHKGYKQVPISRNPDNEKTFLPKTRYHNYLLKRNSKHDHIGRKDLSMPDRKWYAGFATLATMEDCNHPQKKFVAAKPRHYQPSKSSGPPKKQKEKEKQPQAQDRAAEMEVDAMDFDVMDELAKAKEGIEADQMPVSEPPKPRKRRRREEEPKDYVPALDPRNADLPIQATHGSFRVVKPSAPEKNNTAAVPNASTEPATVKTPAMPAKTATPPKTAETAETAETAAKPAETAETPAKPAETPAKPVETETPAKPAEEESIHCEDKNNSTKGPEKKSASETTQTKRAPGPKRTVKSAPKPGPSLPSVENVLPSRKTRIESRKRTAKEANISESNIISGTRNRKRACKS